MKEENNNRVIIYKSTDGKSEIAVQFEGEMVWLTQQQMAELFKTTKQNVNLHIRNIYNEGELSPEATVKDSLTVQTEGGREVHRQLMYYNLDVIRRLSHKKYHRHPFRQWATQRLREYIEPTSQNIEWCRERLSQVNSTAREASKISK